MINLRSGGVLPAADAVPFFNGGLPAHWRFLFHHYFVAFSGAAPREGGCLGDLRDCFTAQDGFPLGHDQPSNPDSAPWGQRPKEAPEFELKVSILANWADTFGHAAHAFGVDRSEFPFSPACSFVGMSRVGCLR